MVIFARCIVDVHMDPEHYSRRVASFRPLYVFSASNECVQLDTSSLSLVTRLRACVTAGWFLVDHFITLKPN